MFVILMRGKNSSMETLVGTATLPPSFSIPTKTTTTTTATTYDKPFILNVIIVMNDNWHLLLVWVPPSEV